MSLVVSSVNPDFVGRIEGIDLRVQITPDIVKKIEKSLDFYAVLVFPNQEINDEQQLDFTKNLGETLGTANTTKTGNLRLNQAFADVSNLDVNNQIVSPNDRQRAFALGNRLWHSDASFRKIPARYSILSARVVPPAGGETEFADMRAAHESLDKPTKLEIKDLFCKHSLAYSRARLGFTDFTDNELTSLKPSIHPLVRSHPVSGRKSIFLSAHIGGIVDWLQPEAMAFLFDLTEHATQRTRIVGRPTI